MRLSRARQEPAVGYSIGRGLGTITLTTFCSCIGKQLLLLDKTIISQFLLGIWKLPLMLLIQILILI